MARIKFAIVGCGRVAARHVEVLKSKIPGAEISAVCDLVPARSEKLSQELGVPAFTSSAEMYRSVDIDVADIATPSGDHFERVMEAISYGKHVVVEKPVALRLEHADAMTEEAARKKVKLWVVHQNRYNPAVVKAKEAMDLGRFGKMVIGTVRVRWFRDQAYYNNDTWRGTWALDGGVISQQAIHHVDALRWFMGDVESVQAVCSTRLVDIECEDVCIALLKFKSGAVGIIEAMTAARPRDMEASLSLMGENGSIILGGLAMNKIDFWEFSKPDSSDKWVPELFSQEVPNAYGFGHEVVFSRVVESILQNSPVEITAEEGKKTLEIIHAVYSSQEAGRPVMMSEKPVSCKLGVRSKFSLKSTRFGKGKKGLDAIQELVSNNLEAANIGRKKFTGILGDSPSKTAKSPFIWNKTFMSLGVDAVYLPFDVSQNNLENIVSELRESDNYLGGSVAVPYKIAVMKYLDEVEEKAKLSGSVNVIVRTIDGRLIGYNTDGKGGIDALTTPLPGKPSAFRPSLKGDSILIIGAGGVSRSMAFYAASAIGTGGSLAIANRTFSRAAELASQVHKIYQNARAVPFEQLTDAALHSNLIINCTNCGQSGMRSIEGRGYYFLEPYSPLAKVLPTPVQHCGEDQTGLAAEFIKTSSADIFENNKISLDLILSLKPDVDFFDVVYSPLETVFLRQARLAGHNILNGKAMNISQAAEAMFNRVLKSYFEERGMHHPATYRKIVEVMYEVW